MIKIVCDDCGKEGGHTDIDARVWTTGDVRKALYAQGWRTAVGSAKDFCPECTAEFKRIYGNGGDRSVPKPQPADEDVPF